MTTFTFNAETFDIILQDMNNGHTVKLSKTNGSAVILCDGVDIDEFGDNIYRMTIQPAEGEPSVKRAPMNETDIWNLLFGEKFTKYEIINA